jgi:hypothetical protein
LRWKNGAKFAMNTLKAKYMAPLLVLPSAEESGMGRFEPNVE